MRSLSGLGIGLSLVFGCLILALVAEIYYLLWYKKRIINREIEDDYSSFESSGFFYLLCWKKPSSLSSTALNPQELNTSMRIRNTHDLESSQTHLSNSGKDYLLKPNGENNVETELMRLCNLSNSSRLLFTINEETKEDLESEDGKSKCDKSPKGSGGRSLNDLILSVETPYFTPLSSPSFLTHPQMTPLESYSNHGFNPLFESSKAAEISRIKSSPPKFKFLKDADERLYRETLMEETENNNFLKKKIDHDNVDTVNGDSSIVTDEEDGSFITILVSKNKEKEIHHHLPQQSHSSSSSQVLPLDTSPSSIRPINVKPMFNWSSKD